jgi:DNA-binding CsgD family transcriptional regulator
VSELEKRAQAREVCVLVGECVELAEGELAFAPIISALRGVMEEPASVEWLEAAERSSLASLWPVVGAGESLSGGRELLFEAVYRVLARLAAGRPVLLIVEDVHWIDRSSRDLLAFLVRNARHDRIAVLTTFRPDELPRGHPLRPFVSELERSGRAERVDLVPLRRSEVAEQLEAIVGHAPAAEVVERIFTRSEGNPFFAEELLASADAAARELPGSLREALLLRIERLSELTREVLRVAAVVGRSVDHRLLASVVGVGEPDLLAGLREAADHHVLVASVDGAAYVFRHALLREAIYDDTLIGERLRLHRAIAATLDAHREYAGEAPAAELAYHWLAAGEERAALAASVEAASEAEGMHALGEAVGHIDRVLGLWERVAGPEDAACCDKFELLIRGSELADFSGDGVHGLALAERARAEIDERTEPLRAARAEARIGRSLQFSGRGADALEHLAAARRLVPKEPPTLEYAEALAAEGRTLMLNDLPREARERLEEAISIAERLGALEVQASALNSLAIVYSDLGDFERAITAGRDGLRISEQIGSVEEIMRAYVNGSQALEDPGRIEEALAMYVEGIAVGERLGMSRVAGDILRGGACWLLLRIGRLADAERMIGPALENATTTFNVAGSHCFAARLALERGDLDLAERRLETAWPLMQRSGGFQLIGPALATRVLLELARGDLQHARERAREGLARAVLNEGKSLFTAELYWLTVRVEAEQAELARTGEDREAVGRCERAAIAALDGFKVRLSKAGGDRPPESGAYLALAEAELTRLRAERTPRPWKTAAEGFRAIGANYPAAYAELRAAEALALAGARVAEIAVPLRSAHATAVEIGSPPFLTEVLALGRRAGVPLGPPDEDPRRDVVAELGLTERELEVLRLLADGRTNRQIGEELFITPKTASVHVSRILMKLGVANRAEAAAAAHRMGLARQVGVD